LSYLRLRRGQLAIACFLLTSLLFLAVPGIDLLFSRLFFENGFVLRTNRLQEIVQDGIGISLTSCMLLFTGVYVFNRRRNRRLWEIDGRKLLYLFAVLVLGAGLIVNALLKDHLGRARPRDIAEFGGSRQFTPAYVPSGECARNCSFPTGDGAAAFFSLAVSSVFRRKRALVIAGVSLGVAVSLSRIAAGAHFLSDAVVSFFVMWLIADILYHYMLEPRPLPHPAGVVGAAGAARSSS
jgi:lipid A 4'-phosphatase